MGTFPRKACWALPALPDLRACFVFFFLGGGRGVEWSAWGCLHTPVCLYV